MARYCVSRCVEFQFVARTTAIARSSDAGGIRRNGTIARRKRKPLNQRQRSGKLTGLENAAVVRIESNVMQILNSLRGKGSSLRRYRRPMVELLEDRTFMSNTPTASLLVPAYFYPVANGGWDRMAAAAEVAPVTAILNPDSGPGSSADPVYAAAINKLRGDGGRVVGYIHTSYGKRPLAAVEAEVNAYASFYALDGFFVDEMATTSAEVTYYQALYAFIKTLNANYEVIGNPGTSTQQTYLTSPAADVLVDFEGNQAAYGKASPPSWVSNFGSEHFGSIVGRVGKVKTMYADLSRAKQRNAGYVYVTDQNLGNFKTAYDRLPVYWNQEVAAMAAENG
jgi:hypothetical protein